MGNVSSTLGDEFLHLNGTVEPMASVAVPQGIYTSANISVQAVSPVCVGQSPGELLIDGALNGSATATATVSLSGPITVTGTAMGLVLNLDVSKSAPFSGECVSGLSVMISPVFTLSPMTIAGQPTNSSNGRLLGMRGVISAVASGGTGFTVKAFTSYWSGTPQPWTLGFNGSTVFQGVGGASQLAAGSAVDMDATMQPDGSLVATRVEVLDANATNLAVGLGPAIANYPLISRIQMLQVQVDGNLPGLGDAYNVGSATYSVSGQFANLQSLPFTASFNAANAVAGQNIFFGSNAASVNGFPPLPLPATSLTLMPQTIDGTVSAISSAGGFTTYTVTLPSYDAFPNLAVQPGQTTLLTNPNTVVVYADAKTQMLNTSAIAVGGTVRFYGLVFNDNGTLRMDCAQVNDGMGE